MAEANGEWETPLVVDVMSLQFYKLGFHGVSFGYS